jgi:hypothetical protein
VFLEFGKLAVKNKNIVDSKKVLKLHRSVEKRNVTKSEAKHYILELLQG